MTTLCLMLACSRPLHWAAGVELNSKLGRPCKAADSVPNGKVTNLSSDQTWQYRCHCVAQNLHQVELGNPNMTVSTPDMAHLEDDTCSDGSHSIAEVQALVENLHLAEQLSQI